MEKLELYMKNFIFVFLKPYFLLNHKDSFLTDIVLLKNVQNFLLNRMKGKNFVNDPVFFNHKSNRNSKNG